MRITHEPIKGTILIVYPEAFALGWRGATARLLDLSYALSHFGWRVTMLSAKEWISHDQTQQERLFQGEIIRTPFTGSYPIFFDSHKILRRIYRLFWKLRGNKYYHENLALGWASKIRAWVKDNFKRPSPNIVWAICTSNINGIIAGQYLAKLFNRPLILEFQDPPSSPMPGKVIKLYSTLQPLFEKCLRLSDGIVCVTEAYRQYLINKYGISSEKIQTLYLSYRPLETPFQEKQEKKEGLILLHAGSLYTGHRRNARSLVEALALFIHNNSLPPGSITFRLVGGGQGASEAKGLAKSLNISWAIETLHEVPFDTAIREMYNADVLVVIKHADPQYDLQIPGKLFQYIGTGKFILGIMRKETEAAKIINNSGLGIVVENTDIKGIVRALDSIWKNKLNLRKLQTPNPDFISKFSIEQFAHDCNNFIDKIISSKLYTSS